MSDEVKEDVEVVAEAPVEAPQVPVEAEVAPVVEETPAE